MVTPTLACQLLAVLALGGLLWARKRDALRGIVPCKLLSSLLFLAVAFLEPVGQADYTRWIRIGLVASLLGDLFLIGEGRAWVGAGLFAFLAAHAAYLVAVWPLVAVGDLSWRAAVIALPLLGAAGFALRAAWPKLGKLLVPAIVYAAALGTMTVLALGCWWLAPRDPGRALLGLGMLLFFVSDLSVARHRFVQASFTNKAWGLPAYYLAQHLLALSIARV